MSEILTYERPGVYPSYEDSSLTSAKPGSGTVCIAANGGSGGPYQWTSYGRAVADVGLCPLSELTRIALKNGAGSVYGIPAGNNYTAAFETAAALNDVKVMVCDSTDPDVQKALRDTVESCSAQRKERIAVVSGSESEDVSDLIARAAVLNHPRIVLVSPSLCSGNGAACAAAVAGTIAGSSDPALPLGGTVLRGMTGTDTIYANSDLDLMARGGVTPLEMMGGSGSMVYAVTTCADPAWRELSAVLTADEVIPAIRHALCDKFTQSKNTARTRGAIRSLVELELQNRVDREMIGSYENVSVTALESDPTVCLVEFAFTVARGLNHIRLSAHITV